MSDLRKFEDSQEFREKLKEFLLTPHNVRPEPPVVEYQRYSFDISADLQQTIEEKLIACGKKLPKIQEVKTMDVTAVTSDFKALNMDNAEDSFVMYEQICNKSISDPDSTLYKYMHSDRKEDVIANALGRHSDNNKENQCEVLKNEENMTEFCKNYLATHKIEDVTQLEEVEAPSGLWENSHMTRDHTFATSPIKMVALMRPSTILEETEVTCNRESQTTRSYSVATDYETAADYTSSTQARTEPYYSLNSDIMQKADSDVSTNKNQYMQLDETQLNSSVIDIDGGSSDFDQSMSLLNVSNPSYKIEEGEEEIQEISTLQEDGEKQNVSFDVEPVKSDTIEAQEMPSTSCILENNDNNKSYFLESGKNDEENSLNDSVIEILSDEADEEDNENKENEINSSDSLLNISGMTYTAEEKLDLNKDSPHVFNDTLEEVDYLLRKGMELRLAQQQQQQKDDSKNASPLKVNNFTGVLSPKCDNSPKSQKKKTHENNQKKTGAISKLLMKPYPKFEFKKPLDSATKKTPSHKVTASKKFDHIVSPISMYVKHGGNAPLMTNIRHKTSEHDVQNSSIFNNLKKREFFNKNDTENKNLDTSNVLPKKKYISADLKQVVDKRTPMTIPGGQKIQQYIQPALMASVIKHHGKVHLNPVQRELFKHNSPRKQTHTKSTVDDSLRDISVMSGDVSLCTIKDAKKY